MAEHIIPYTGQKSYTLEIGKLKRELPLVGVGSGTYIAFFESLGDVELINSSAKALADHLKECDILITSETKGISLAQAIATILSHDKFIVLRKERKSFMLNPIVQRYKPITSSTEKELYLDSSYIKLLKGKKVGIVDDVVSSRATLDAITLLVKKAGGNVTKSAVILAEGTEQPDVISLGVLPIFKTQ